MQRAATRSLAALRPLARAVPAQARSMADAGGKTVPPYKYMRGTVSDETHPSPHPQHPLPSSQVHAMPRFFVCPRMQLHCPGRHVGGMVVISGSSPHHAGLVRGTQSLPQPLRAVWSMTGG